MSDANVNKVESIGPSLLVQILVCSYASNGMICEEGLAKLFPITLPRDLATINRLSVAASNDSRTSLPWFSDWRASLLLNFSS